MPFCSFVAVRASGLEGEKEFRIGKGMGHRSSYPHCPSVFEIGALCPDSYMYCFHTPVSVPSLAPLHASLFLVLVLSFMRASVLLFYFLRRLGLSPIHQFLFAHKFTTHVVLFQLPSSSPP